jgi:1-phosphatidylinositol-4-phosphate 5-kinase
MLHTSEDVIAVGDVLRRRVLSLLMQGLRVAVHDIRPELVEALARNPRAYGPLNEALGTRTYAAGNSIATEEWREQREGECRFRDYCGPLFARLRALAGINDESYARIMREEHFVNSESLAQFSQGRSGSFFCYSPCQSVLIKTIDRSEARVLKRLLPDMLAYLSEQPGSLLARFLGFHSLRFQEGIRIYVLVMLSVLHAPYALTDRFDLKGSWVDRRTPHRAAGSTGKDLDLGRQHRLRLAPHAASQLWAQLNADVAFLAGQHIMDYSLLVGFAALGEAPPAPPSRDPLLPPRTGLLSADGSEEYYIGIIDYLQQYDINKKLERLWKVYGKCADPAGISVQPVAVYSQRFTYRIPLLLSP